MIAEVENKGKWETINSEDELTGNFFGNLRYLPFNKGLKRILIGTNPPELGKTFDRIDIEDWADCIHFWKRENEVEPDVLIEFDNTVILIEVKYNSGLSSPDQLVKYGKLLSNFSGERKKILILLALEGNARRIYDEFVEINKAKDLKFGYITWQKAFDILTNINGLSIYESVIVNDLVKLLNKKGFGGFRNFDVSRNTIDKTEMWTFDCLDNATNEFSFILERSVERNLYYEFG